MRVSGRSSGGKMSEIDGLLEEPSGGGGGGSGCGDIIAPDGRDGGCDGGVRCSRRS